MGAWIASTPKSMWSVSCAPTAPRQRIPLPVDARTGPAAPWAELSLADRHIDTATVREAFRDLAPPVPSPREREAGLPAAAVLAPLYDEDGEANVILTRRHIQLRAHSGEVAFPGGRAEPGETLEQTARRETQEEIALRSPVEMIGELDHLSTITSGSFIVPYVGVLPEPPIGLVANPGEVEAILPVRPRRPARPDACTGLRSGRCPGEASTPSCSSTSTTTPSGARPAAMLRQLLGFITGTVGRGELGHT